MYIINPMPEQIAPELIAGLLETDTGTIGHFMEQAMDPGISAKMPGSKIAGTAITIQVTVPDSLIGHYALKFVRPGDILVVDRGTDQRTSCFGGTSNIASAALGVRGLIMDGAGNDIAEANACGLPIWCRGVTPLTTRYLNIGGGLNVPIVCGGLAVNPGDAIMADENGVLVIPAQDVRAVVDKARVLKQKEEAMRAKMRENPGLCFPDMIGTTDLVEAKLREQAAQP
jgi:4-hydroxy-4-methyl-2-oxoglutarate aldolase